VEGNLTEQKYLLWFAVCKTYKFVQEIAVEVLREKFLNRSMKITDLDYDSFLNRKADLKEPRRDYVNSAIRAAVKRVLQRRKIREEDLEPFLGSILIQAQALYAD